MTSQYSIYIPIGITYKDYKAEYFAAYIDNGSGKCRCKPDIFPKEYHQDLPITRGRDISNNIVTMSRGTAQRGDIGYKSNWVWGSRKSLIPTGCGGPENR